MSDDDSKPTANDTDKSNADFQRRVTVISGVVGVLLTVIGLAEKMSSLGLRVVSNVLLYVGLPLIAVFLAAGAARVSSLRELGRKFRELNDRYLQPIAPIVTLLAILIASILISVKIDLMNVRATEYVDEFPQNIDQVNELIGRTKRELLIGTDFAAYGGYTSPAKAAEYRRRIEAAKENGAAVRMVVFSDALLDDWIEKWFGDLEVLGNKFNQANWANFARYNQSFTDRPQDLAAVKKFFRQFNRKFITELEEIKVNDSQIKQTDESLALFYWVRDKEEAIFSFSCERPVVGLGEVSFRTTDPKIIEALVGNYVKTTATATPAAP